MKPFILLFLSALLLFSCNNTPTETASEKSPVDSLYNIVMEVHDKLMPEMGNIAKYRNQITSHRNSLLEEFPEGNELTQRMRDNIAELNKAETLMFDWMSDFSGKYDSLSVDEKIGFLHQNKVLVDKMEEVFNNSLNEAKAILAEIDK